LIKGKKAREAMVERLVGYAVALIDAERKRRAATVSVKK
jgi:hypothetical protein